MPYKDPDVRRAKAREYCRAWRARNPGWQQEMPSYGKRYFKPTKEAHRAHVAVANAIKRGILVRPATCSKCGKQCRPEAAHHDYAKQLDVRWLCMSCHRMEDCANAKGGTERA